MGHTDSTLSVCVWVCGCARVSNSKRPSSSSWKLHVAYCTCCVQLKSVVPDGLIIHTTWSIPRSSILISDDIHSSGLKGHADIYVDDEKALKYPVHTARVHLEKKKTVPIK